MKLCFLPLLHVGAVREKCVEGKGKKKKKKGKEGYKVQLR